MWKVGQKIVLFSNERHFEIWFPKKKTITFFWSKLSKPHKKDPILHVATTFFPKTRGNKNKPWTHSTPLNTVVEPNLVWLSDECLRHLALCWLNHTYIWFFKSTREFYFEKHLLCSILHASSQVMEGCETPILGHRTAVLLRGHRSNSTFGPISVYIPAVAISTWKPLSSPVASSLKLYKSKCTFIIE